MEVITTNLPQGYKEIIISTKDGFVLSKSDESYKTMEIAFTDERFSVQKEVKLLEYERSKHILIINPNNISTFGYLSVDSILTIYNNEGEVQRLFDIKCANAGFDDDDNLYIAERIDSENLLLSIFDKNLELLATKEVIDPIYESYVDFEFHPKLKRMFLSLAGGQDGCIYYTLDFNKPIIELKEFARDLAIIETDDENKHFLSIDSYACLINYYTYPDLDLVSSFDYFENFDGEELNFSLVHLKENIFIIFFNGIPYIYDALKGLIKREIKLEGHLSKPVNEFYPTIDDEGLMTDVVSAQRFDSIIGFSTMNSCGFYVNVEDIL